MRQIAENPAQTDNVYSFKNTKIIHLLNLSCEAVTVTGVMIGEPLRHIL